MKDELDSLCGFQEIYVLAPSRLVFMEFVRDRGLNLQRCKYLGRAEDMVGIDWSSPLRELVQIGEVTRMCGPEGYAEARVTMISRYCLHKRVHDIRRISL